jgi:pimeloyl-ACP methyl ester carboxylesterase
LSKRVYRSAESKLLLIDLYEKYLKKLSYTFSERYINTTYGNTHIITMGNSGNFPLVILHGGNTVNPFDLKLYESLSEKFFIIAPDLIGQPGKSEENVLSPRTLDYGLWLKNCLDELRIKKAHFIGTSVGGGVLLNFAIVDASRIAKAVLLAPMGLGFGFATMYNAISKLMVPYIKYKIKPSEAKLYKAIVPLFYNVDSITEDWLEMLRFSYNHLSLSDGAFRSPSKKELRGFLSQTIIVTSINDVLAPGKLVRSKANQIIKNIKKIYSFDEDGHIMSKKNELIILKIVKDFLV